MTTDHYKLQTANCKLKKDVWPVFTDRYPAEIAAGKPEYWDPLILLLIVLLGAIGFLVTRLGQKGTAHTLQLVTLRPRNIVTFGEYHIPPGQYGIGILFAVIQISLLLLLIGIRSGAFPGDGLFWLRFSEIALAVILLFAGHYLLMAWAGYTFSGETERRLLLSNVSILFILFGASLVLPIALLIFSKFPYAVSLGTAVLLYFSYRVWFLVRSLSILTVLLRVPFLIIWYLCVCELAPLYLAFEVVTHF